MTDLIWPAPAKLNLFLHITGRRSDGYHELQTVFQFLDHGDCLRFVVRADGVIQRCTELEGIPAERDLTVRAARLLQTAGGTTLGADIYIDKRLPTGGGLGGGSSDAATTLLALNHLWGLELDLDTLATLGLRLGADVPIFVRGHAAWAEGVGEKIEPIDPEERWYLVIVPPVHVSTAEIFNDLQLTRDCNYIKIPAFLAGQCTNVCEPIVRKRYPAVAAALDWLSRFAPARMTGTGACVFAGFVDEHAARDVFSQLPAGWRGFVAKGVNISPAHAMLQRLRRV
ncbi:MAG: 4-(cytidine 5'-diphospho)-2-C-methyl-D-erythritol kinase [Pseudomonadota bacterium]